MDLSIVTTLYCSAAYLERFYVRARAAAEKVVNDFEIIMVNDGSPDDSLQIALSLQEIDPRIKVVDLSRNFGHHKAMMTGLTYATGELVFLIDSDLEEEPELLETFYERLKGAAADVVFGVQKKRKGKMFERVSGAVFFKAFNALSTHPLPRNVVTARLMSAKYVQALIQHRERETLIAGLWVITGFKQIQLPIEKKHNRHSTYNLRRKLAHFVNAVTSFSSKPLELIFYLGCLILILSTLAALVLIIRKLFFGSLLVGWPSLIVSIWLLGGLTIFCLGIIGIYLSKIFIEVKQRPYTIVKQIYGGRAGDRRLDRNWQFEESSEDMHELR
jgi:putative glycosyltransferase